MRNLQERLADEHDRAAFAAPPFVQRMLDKGLLGEKTGKGFYERRKTAGGESEISCSISTRSSIGRASPRGIASIEAGKSIDDLGERVRMLFSAKDKAGEFLRETLAPTLVYTARVTPAIAHSIDDVDRVMRWGFAWELGPFELFDTIGVREVLAAAGRSGRRPRDARRHPAARQGRARPRPQPLPRRAGAAGGARPADPADREGTGRRREEERRREPGGPRRRRAGGGVPLEDERDRRRHDPDAAGRRQGSRRRTSVRWSSATTRRTSRPAPT